MTDNLPQNRVEQLERELAEVRDELAAERRRLDLLVAASGQILYEYDVASGAIAWRGAYDSVLGFGPEEMLGGIEQWSERIHREDEPEALRLLGEAEQAVGRYEVEYRFRRSDGGYAWLFDRGYFMAGADGKAARMYGIMQDITARKLAEQERLAAQEAIIEAQQLALRELSTPLIPVTDDTVVLPIVGAMDSNRAQQVLEALLTGISEHQAAVAIIDITGVHVVDTQVANGLLQAARAASLLGARVVLTGIGPEVAQTLVGLGVDMSGITTRGTLQDGIAAALKGR